MPQIPAILHTTFHYDDKPYVYRITANYDRNLARDVHEQIKNWCSERFEPHRFHCTIEYAGDAYLVKFADPDDSETFGREWGCLDAPRW